MRNTRIVDVIAELQTYRVDIDVYDPWADPIGAEHEYEANLTDSTDAMAYAESISAFAIGKLDKLKSKHIGLEGPAAPLSASPMAARSIKERDLRFMSGIQASERLF